MTDLSWPIRCARSAARLAQPEQRLERGHHAAAGLEHRRDLALGGGADRVVGDALGLVLPRLTASAWMLRGRGSLQRIAVDVIDREIATDRHQPRGLPSADDVSRPRAVGFPADHLDLGTVVGNQHDLAERGD
jgi:hypothetical protein